MRKKLTIFLIGLFFALASFVFKEEVSAVSYSEKIKNFDVEISINPDSSLLVKESILYDFGGHLRHGIFRDIPKKDIEIKVLEVKDEFNNPYPYSVKRKGKYLDIKIGDPDKLIKGEHLYNISYKIGWGIKFFKGHDELYWNVTGNEWEVPIESSGVKIHLPQEIARENLQFACFTGVFGSKEEDCVYGLDEKGDVYFESKRGFAPQEGLTIVLGLPKGIIFQPGIFQRIIWFIKRNWSLFVPFFVFLFLFKEWWQKGRDFPLKKPIIAQYEAPESLGPAEVGTIMKQKIKTQDVSATIIDLAVRGFIKIKEKKGKGLIFKKLDYIFVRLKDFSKDESLKNYERKILRSIFQNKESVTLSGLKNNFYRHFSPIKNKIYKELGSGGYFVSRPDKVRGKWLAVGIGIIILGFSLLSLGIGMAFIFSGVLFLIFSFFMPKRTKKGADAYWKCLGLKEYIDTAERYRLQFQEQEKIFEKYLPYAIVFGIVNKWAKAFEGIYITPPSWYEGDFGPSFSVLVFSHSLQNTLSQMNSAFVSRPGGRGSGFGGGGFSGGGGGGGGGGSW